MGKSNASQYANFGSLQFTFSFAIIIVVIWLWRKGRFVNNVRQGGK